MTKDQEIAKLDEIISNLPKQTYLASVLKHLRLEIINDIRSDFETLPDLNRIQEELAQAIIRRDEAERDAREQDRMVKLLYSNEAALRASIEDAKSTLRRLDVSINLTLGKFA